MKTSAKIATAAAATLAAGAAFYALPAMAHERGHTFSSSDISSSSPMVGAPHDEQHATLSATITSIPSTVTSSHEASHGAYFTAYVLDDTATTVPTTEPTTGGHRVRLMPPRFDASASDVISGSTLEGVVGFHADVDGLTKLALYPSDGTDPILVTVTTATDGSVSVVSSADLTVAYSADVAAQVPAMPQGGERGGHKGPGDHGMRGDHGLRGGNHDGDGPSGQMGFSQSDITPNA